MDEWPSHVRSGGFEGHRGVAQAVIAAALRAGDPVRAVHEHWPSGLAAACGLVAIGKASIGMTFGAGKRAVLKGLVTAVPELATTNFGQGLCVLPCDHPLPTERNVLAAKAVAEFVGGLGREDTLLVLISGGGSAHLTLPCEGLAVTDLAAVTHALQLAGAAITEINAVRKHCEELKGGRLAAMTAARVVALIMSDVVGDRLDAIASGPTVADTSTYSDAVDVLERYGAATASEAVSRHLARGVAGEIEETPKPGHPAFRKVVNTIVASNHTVINAVAGEMARMGFHVSGVERGVVGDAASAGQRLAEHARRMRLEGGSVPRCVVLGGETTVDASSGTGAGGPSQEMALSAAIGFDGLEGVALVTFSTDGRDGPTDAAGAVVTGETCGRARAMGLNPTTALREHDSYGLLDGVGALLRTGATGTNLNHVAVLLVYP